MTNVHEPARQVIKFDKLQFITTGEKIINDANKQRWVHRPKNDEQASVMFFIQLSETPYEAPGIKSF